MLLEDYQLTQLVGRGNFGDVFLTTKKNSNISYATKRMDRELAEHPAYCKYFVNEVSILRNIEHKNIVKLEDLKKTKKHYYIIMEYCNGGSLKSNLEKYMNKYNNPFPEKVVQHIMRQIVSAINYLHGLKIVHRDLKLDNILVKYSCEEDKKSLNLLNAEIKLVDFGFATHISNVSLLKSAIGSPLNMDPRILKKFSSHAKCPQSYDEKADIWSLGTLCYQMLMGEYAFVGNSVQEISSKIEEGTFKVPINLAKETISFLINMLQYDAEKRSNASELSKHPFLNKSVDDFTYINLKNVSKKVSYGDLYINIKDNKTICSVINKEGEKQFNIDSTDLLPKEKKDSNNNPVDIKDERRFPQDTIPKNQQEIINSAPLPNSPSTNKDPVINQLLNIHMPQQEKSLLNSLININKNKTLIIKSSSKSIIEGQQNLTNITFGNQENEKKYSKTLLYPSNKNQINPQNNPQMQITPKKMDKNQLYNNNNYPNSQNNNQMKYNQINRSVGNVGPRALSSQNLAYLQFQNSDGKYNTMIPQGKVSDFNLGMNNDYDARKMNYSDNKLPIMGTNDINANNNLTGYKMQPFSSKILNFGNLNINDKYNTNIIGQNNYYK